ncbi:MAG: hypothetical protein HC892_11310 [Saprospiraceae bacterium]|nr:hypothetical protein [Saprospiraceae bacterium]
MDTTKSISKVVTFGNSKAFKKAIIVFSGIKPLPPRWACQSNEIASASEVFAPLFFGSSLQATNKAETNKNL